MLLILFSISLCFSWVSPESHSLRYYYTSMWGSAEFPEFIHVGILDDMQITYYDSIIQKDIPRQPWMNRALAGDYWDKETKKLIYRQKLSLANVKIVIRRTNSSNNGLNFLQYTSGCVLNDDGTVSGVRQYAFNGRDLISFDLEHTVWVTASPAALATKNKWNKNKADNQYKKHYTQEICIECLKKYLEYAAHAMGHKVAPEVMVYARKSPDGQKLTLVCLVTGFYPARINVTWIKEGQPLDKPASTGILPNHDGTYQIKKFFHTEPGDRQDYVCHVEHSSFSEGRDITWDKTCDGEGLNPWVIPIVLLILLVGIAGITGYSVYNWREDIKRVCHLKAEPEKNYSPAASSENGQSRQTHPNQGISEGSVDQPLV